MYSFDNPCPKAYRFATDTRSDQQQETSKLRKPQRSYQEVDPRTLPDVNPTIRIPEKATTTHRSFFYPPKTKYMAFKKFDATNSMESSPRGAKTINFYKTGLISFSKKAVEEMGLSEGDTIALLQDEDDPKEWCIAKDTSGLALRRRKKNDGSLLLCSLRWHREITEAIGIDEDKNVSMIIVTKPTVIIDDSGIPKGYSIITSAAKTVSRKSRATTRL